MSILQPPPLRDFPEDDDEFNLTRSRGTSNEQIQRPKNHGSNVPNLREYDFFGNESYSSSYEDNSFENINTKNNKKNDNNNYYIITPKNSPYEDIFPQESDESEDEEKVKGKEEEEDFNFLNNIIPRGRISETPPLRGPPPDDEILEDPQQRNDFFEDEDQKEKKPFFEDENPKVKNPFFEDDLEEDDNEKRQYNYNYREHKNNFKEKIEIEKFSSESEEEIEETKKTKKISKHWKLGALIGEGGFGKVFEAMDTKYGTFFAAKQISLESNNMKNTKNFNTFQNEINLLKKLKHKNIVEYLGSQFIGKFFYIFLEYVPQGSLSTLLQKYGSFSLETIRQYCVQILKGLRYLHRKKIIHRDIKGGNILVSGTGETKVADFGCSKELLEGSQVNSVLGTAYWMAPEVIRGEDYSFSADIWSFGATVIEMATTQPPYRDQYPIPQKAVWQIANAKKPPKIPNFFSEKANLFVTSCMNIIPEMRPSSSQLLNFPFILENE